MKKIFSCVLFLMALNVTYAQKQSSLMIINDISIVDVVNNITIPSSIFHNNTTYIWDGYIKTNSTGYFNVSINSKIKTIISVKCFNTIYIFQYLSDSNIEKL